MSDVLTVKSPTEVVESIPYLLGFHPSESLVVLGLNDDQIVRVVARVDLDCDAEGLEMIVSRFKAVEVIAMVLAVFTETAGDFPYAKLVSSLALRAARVGTPVHDAMLVRGDHWWSYMCAGQDCCPAEGNPRSNSTPLAAHAVLRGFAPLATREALGDIFIPEAELLSDELIRNTPAALCVGIVQEISRAEEPDLPSYPIAKEAAAIIAALYLLPAPMARDVIWLLVDADHNLGRRLWEHLARITPAPYRAAPLFLWAWMAWRRGESVQALIAVELALEADPNYSAAHLLQLAIQDASDPGSIPPLAQAGANQVSYASGTNAPADSQAPDEGQSLRP